MLTDGNRQPQAMLRHPPLPAGRKAYVIGDIHGCSDLLGRLHRAIDRDSAEDPSSTVEIYLGDYVDRGPDSAGVIARLIERRRHRRTVFIRGNHEIMFKQFLLQRLAPDRWFAAGGLETLKSYGVGVDRLLRAPRQDLIAATLRNLPIAHRRFFGSLRDSLAFGGYFFTHAGVRPGVPLNAQKPADLQWIDRLFLDDQRDHGAIVVHGHSPNREPEVRHNRINLDTGAYATGRLTCLIVDHAGPRFLEQADGQIAKGT